MIELIINSIIEGKIISIVACSELGRKYYDLIKKIDINARIVFLDNDEYKQQQGFCGEKVLAPNNIEKENIGLFVIASVHFYGEFEKQLISLGIEQSKIVYISEIEKIEKEKLKRIIDKRIAKEKINFVVDLAEHCNLNCQCCDHFSPLAKEYFTDKVEFENDIKRMAFLFGGRGEQINYVALEGGEPLLNPDVIDYIEIIHRYMPDIIIKIFTNGLLLDKQDKSFWNICADYGVELEVTKYPIKYDYSKVEMLAKENNVVFNYFSGGDTIKESMHKPLNLRGDSNIYDSFHKCYMGNGVCTMLKHGRIYNCTVVPNLSIFNDYFGKNIEVCDRDSIDIYKVDTADEILDFLANPVPACRYCQPDKWTRGHEWRTTTYQLSEWAE